MRQQRRDGRFLYRQKSKKYLSKHTRRPSGKRSRGSSRPVSAAASLSASLTVEAALVLTLFIFTVILMAMPMEMLDTHRRIQMTLESLSREMSQDAWLLTAKGHGRGQDAGGEADPEEEGGSFFLAFLNGAAEGYLIYRISEQAGDKIEHLDVSGTRISQDGLTIDLRASYRAKLPFGFPGLRSVPFSARSLRRGWIGKKGGGPEGPGGTEEIMVYVGKDSTRYHRSPSCHYISNKLRVIGAGRAGAEQNGSGRTYQPCAVCGGEPSEVYYVLPEGERYHSRPDCSSLSYYVRMVPLSEAEYLGPCSYCGGGTP